MIVAIGGDWLEIERVGLICAVWEFEYAELESVIFPASVEEIDETAFMYNFDNLKFETQEKIKSIWLDMVQKRKQEFKMLNQFLDSCDK